MSKPEKVFKAGPVRASIFQNSVQRQGKEILFPKVVIEVRYRDKAGNWKGTNSLSLNDLPKAILARQQAYQHLMAKKDEPPTPQPATELDVKTETLA